MLCTTIVVPTEEFLLDKYKSIQLFRTMRQLEGAVDLSKRRNWFADVAVTATSVTWVSGVRYITGIAGATITAGQVVYLDTSVNTYKLAKADAAATAVVAGIALDNTVSGRPMLIAPPGAVITPGGTNTAGTIFVLAADTAGAWCAWADITIGQYVNILFSGTAGNVKLICDLCSATHA